MGRRLFLKDVFPTWVTALRLRAYDLSLGHCYCHMWDFHEHQGTPKPQTPLTIIICFHHHPHGGCPRVLKSLTPRHLSCTCPPPARSGSNFAPVCLYRVQDSYLKALKPLNPSILKAECPLVEKFLSLMNLWDKGLRPSNASPKPGNPGHQLWTLHLGLGLRV